MTLLEHTGSEGQVPWTNFAEFVSAWCRCAREEMRQKLEQEIQGAIEEVEKEKIGSHQRSATHYHTPFGTINIKRRIYKGEDGPICLADKVLMLPAEHWLPEVEELSCALGVGSEFANANRLFQRWTGVAVSDHGLANRVEAAGALLAITEAQEEARPTAPMDSALARQVQAKRAKPRVYLGVDGTMVPRNQGQGAQEARVGVVFWEKDIISISEKRRMIRQKQYVATMQSVQILASLLFKQYSLVVGEQPCEVIFLGDGARWIWSLASECYPECVEILDFYHVSDYVSDVAKAAFSDNEIKRRKWFNEQQSLLKESKHREVIAALKELDQSNSEVVKACESLTRYLVNNESRIDYKTYLEKGFYIGSGVVESSNRKVVTQRIAQAGMHWSEAGVDAMLALRAAYCSSGDRWQDFWAKRATLQPPPKPKNPPPMPNRGAAKARAIS